MSLENRRDPEVLERKKSTVDFESSYESIKMSNNCKNKEKNVKGLKPKKFKKRNFILTKKFQCTFCQKKTTTESNLKRHIQYIHENKVSTEGIKFQSKHDGKKGRKNHKNQIQNEKSSLVMKGKCPICDRKFTRVRNVKKHLIVTHRNRLAEPIKI